MRKPFVFSSLAAGAVAALVAGCVSNTPAPLENYQPENFGASNAFVHRYDVPPVRACEAARRALLSQGYVVDAGKPDQVAGRKYFQPDSNHHVQLEFRVVCVAQGQNAGGGTTVFANGLQDQYSLRKIKESASLGVGAFGSLSLPLAGGNDELVKVASQTMTDAGLYQRFFDLIEGLLASGEVPEPAMPPASEAIAAPASAPVQASSAALIEPAAGAALVEPAAAASSTEPAATAP